MKGRRSSIILHVDEVVLDGGAIAEVVRVGDTVRRSTGPWTPGVHVVLRHLEADGCDVTPRVLGIDERGREILTYLPGTTISPHHLDLLELDETLMRAGTFVAELHAALPRHPDGTLSLHGDLGPWNVLVDGDRWFAIDWDSTHRGEAAWEIAYCLHTFCSRGPARALAPAEAVHRMRAFATGYGLNDNDLATAGGPTILDFHDRVVLSRRMRSTVLGLPPPRWRPTTVPAIVGVHPPAGTSRVHRPIPQLPANRPGGK